METMYDLKQETLDEIKSLVRLNHDAHEGFTTAAEAVEAEPVASLFRSAAAERAQFSKELSEAMQINLEDAPEGGTIRGTAHRWWLNIRGTLNGGDASGILAEAERGESSLVEAYERVAVETAGSPLNAMLHRQLSAVKSVRDRIAELKENRS